MKGLLNFLTLLLVGGGAMVSAQTAFEGLERMELTTKNLEAFLDRQVPGQLKTHHIPGAAIAVVKDGRLLLAKGYGFADLEQQIPVLADKTLFRTGSVAKLFTWTAVMQLVEQGKLDLNADVNTYLKSFKIPATFPEPITLKHLLTHTAGFEDSVFGVLAKDAAGLMPLEAFVSTHIPARVYPPGKVTAYSNFGVTLAGYIVEQTAGVPFDQYVQTQILQPLSMSRTSLSQTLPPELGSSLATGYTYARDTFQPHGFEYYQIAPAGSASATSSDMSRFMLAFLQGGQRILNASTVKAMLTPQFANDPRLSAFGLGFYQMPLSGYRLWGHRGETDFFRTLLVLLPEKNLGIHVAFNAPGGSAASTALVGTLLDHFFPKPIPKPTVSASNDLRDLAGLYAPTRRPQTTVEKITQLLMPLYQPIRVKQSEPGVLELSLPTDPTPKRWLNTSTEVFQREDGKDTAVLKDGYLFLDSVAPKGYERLGWIEQLLFQPWFPLVCLLGLIAAMVVVRMAQPSQASPYGYWLTLISTALALVFAVGFVIFLLTGLGEFGFGVVSPLLNILLILPLLLIPLALGEATFAVVPQWGGGGAFRIGLGLAAVASTAFLLWLNHWKLLGFHY